MIKIAKHFHFDSAHRLDSLPEHHKCHRLHGHTYEVEIRLHGVPDERGFVVDYQDITDAWAPIHNALDHRYLNEVPGLAVPSTEVLVIWIFDRLTESPISALISSVRVSESSTTFAELSARDYKAYRSSPAVRKLLDAKR